MAKKSEKHDSIDHEIFPENVDLSHIQIGRSTEERTLQRVQMIVRTYSADPVAKSYLHSVGFTAAVLEEGWRLYQRAYGVRGSAPEAPPPPAILNLVDRLENEAASIFARAHAVLRRFYPAQEAFVFEGVQTPAGFESVVAMNTFLDRIDELEHGARKDTKKQDQAAVLALDARGITKELRQELRHLCRTVESSPTSARILQASPVPQTEDERALALRALYAWVQDWSETARAVIPDKRLLRRMGIGKRRSRKEKQIIIPAPAQPPQPVPPAPQPPAQNGTTQNKPANA